VGGVGEERRGGGGELVHRLAGIGLHDPAEQHLDVAVVHGVVLVDGTSQEGVVPLVRRLPRLLLSQ
jgi:hypothetical protein